MLIKIITSWKFIIFILGVTAICVYAQLNRYKYTNIKAGVMMRYDKITHENCLLIAGMVKCIDEKTKK